MLQEQDKQKLETMHSNCSLPIWVSSTGSSLITACSGLPGGGLCVLYFYLGLLRTTRLQGVLASFCASSPTEGFLQMQNLPVGI